MTIFCRENGLCNVVTAETLSPDLIVYVYVCSRAIVNEFIFLGLHCVQGEVCQISAPLRRQVII